MAVVALYSMKGGVGKTATAINLAYQASVEGAQTLLIDLDPQGSASYYFRIKPRAASGLKKMFAKKKKALDTIKATDFERLDLLPADIRYRKLDILLNDMKNSKKQLSRMLNPVKKEYDLIFIDCPPSLTLLAENIFSASDIILTPVIPTTLSMISFKKVLNFIRDGKGDPDSIYGFFSMFEKRKSIQRETMQQLRNGSFRFLETVIPYLADVEKMGLTRKPVAEFAPSSPAAAAYLQLWEEVKSTLLEEKDIIW